jgi:hypothetical protein
VSISVHSRLNPFVTQLSPAPFETPLFCPILAQNMKAVAGQLELELRTPEQCRSVRRSRKPGRSRVWFEKMRQVVDDAVERPAAQVAEIPPSSR